MKTICTFTLLLSSLLTFGQPAINSLKNISATVQTLEKALTSSDQEPPAAFIMTMDDFRALANRSGTRIDESRINTVLQGEIGNTALQYRHLKKTLGQIERTISWDTLRYTNRGDLYVDIMIQFVTSITDPFVRSPRKTRVVCEFVVLEDRLLLTENIREVSDMGYDLYEMKMIYRERINEFYRKHQYYVFTSTEGNVVVPFRKQDKWGLMSFQHEIKVPAVYDSIARFDLDYYHVVSKQGHNLLDKNFKPLFAKSRKHIRKTKGSYQVSDDGKNFTTTEKKLSPASGTPASAGEGETYAMIQGPLPTYRKYGERNSDGSNTFTIRDEGTDTVVAVFQGYYDLDLYNNTYLEGRDSANNTVLAECTGKILLKTADIGSFDSGYENLYDKKTRLFGIYCAATNVLVKPKYRYIASHDKFYVVITKEGKLGYLDQHGNELF